MARDMELKLPNYPVHTQVCRITPATVPGPSGYGSSGPAGLNIYVAFTEQLQPTSLLPRDREPCLVLDVNGAGLSPGYYVCRLVGSYTNLPLYEAGGASLGGSGGGNIIITQTINNFIIPGPPAAASGISSYSPGGNVLIIVINTTSFAIGDLIEIMGTANGTTVTLIGYVVTIVNTTQFTFQTVQIRYGNAGPVVRAGDTLLAGAIIVICCPTTPVTRAPVTMPGLGIPFTMPVTTAPLTPLGTGISVADGIGNFIGGFLGGITPNTTPPTIEVLPTFIQSAAAAMSPFAAISPGTAPFQTMLMDPITIPAIGSPVPVRVGSSGWMRNNDEYRISDGTNTAYGFIQKTATDAFTFTPTMITDGTVGTTMSRGAAIVPMSSSFRMPITSSFTLPSVGTSVTVGLPSTGWLTPYQEVVISDGNTVAHGFANPINPTQFTFTPTMIPTGSPGTMRDRASVMPLSTPFRMPTTAGFTAPAVGTGVTVAVPITTPYRQYDTVTIDDGTTYILGYISAILNATSFTFVPANFRAGIATNAVGARAVVLRQGLQVNPLLGRPAPAKTSTLGFVWLPSMSGIPSGTPIPDFTSGGWVATQPNVSDPGIWGLIGGTWKSFTGGNQSANVASAATTDLETASGDYVPITGTTTITAFGTIAAGIRKRLKFADALILTHNATSLILPMGVNITTAAGDVAEVVSEGSGNWRMVSYTRATDPVIIATDGGTVTFDLTKGTKHKVVLGGNRTLALSGDWNGEVFYITLKQDGTGTRTVTWWSNILWPAGTTPTLTTTINKSDDFIFIRISAAEYHGFILGQNI